MIICPCDGNFIFFCEFYAIMIAHTSFHILFLLLGSNAINVLNRSTDFSTNASLKISVKKINQHSIHMYKFIDSQNGPHLSPKKTTKINIVQWKFDTRFFCRNFFCSKLCRHLFFKLMFGLNFLEIFAIIHAKKAVCNLCVLKNDWIILPDQFSNPKRRLWNLQYFSWATPMHVGKKY